MRWVLFKCVIMKYLSTLLLVFVALTGFGQKDDPEQETAFWEDSLQIYESRLVVIGDSLVNSSSQFVRAESAKSMIKVFRQALRIPGAYSYGFDSLMFLSKLSPQDNAFRMFTWILRLDGGKFHYFGVIHMNDPKRFIYHPLFDRSLNEMPRVKGQRGPNDGLEDSIYTNQTWFGMHYYNVSVVKHKQFLGLRGKKYYMLTGWDGNNNISHKKIIDVLTFENGVPTFGAPIFQVGENTYSRIVLEFNAQAVITLKKHEDENVISFDHLMPPTAKNEGDLFTYIPSGQYDYFVWQKDRWVFKEDYFNTHKKQPLGLH